MKYCSECGQTVSKKIPEGEDRLRYVCTSCDTIHYQNPRIIVGTLPVYGEQVLLCRRAIEPRKGFWTLPAGFMENGETTLEGAVRESWEEARANLGNENLYRLFDLPYINQVYMFYRADLADLNFSAGPESLDVALFDEADIPWDEIAFPVVADTLREFFEDRKQGVYPVRVSNTEPVWHKEKS
ncbi:NUDIX hydrolase [Oceanicoccus sagamiensis]|uniref:NUDIX hydrolase n=1 Tax=Oceanicoccus sagamiensis TaxID=716816 RepID=A0A1X9NJU3_9GAMM|nr:NUDIX hydrolase [Oceanicoccus sagamiensis]ARN76105.1 NUDIX hydrolase [Oceanicoccus sagamiensis]